MPESVVLDTEVTAASQITSHATVSSTAASTKTTKKRPGITGWNLRTENPPVLDELDGFLHKGPVIRKAFPWPDVSWPRFIWVDVLYKWLHKPQGQCFHNFCRPVTSQWALNLDLPYEPWVSYLLLSLSYGIAWTDYLKQTFLISLKSDCYLYTMTSSNGNIFTGHRWVPHTKATDAELWCLLWSLRE